jgi:hypothetical protein
MTAMGHVSRWALLGAIWTLPAAHALYPLEPSVALNPHLRTV